MREKRTVHPEQLSTCSSFTQWSAVERPGWSLTDQLNTRPRPSPTRILLWSLSTQEQLVINRYLVKKQFVWCPLSKHWNANVKSHQKHSRNQFFFYPHSSTNTEHLLRNGKRGDFRRMSVVLAVKRCVHGEFAPELQLSLPSVPCSGGKVNSKEHAVWSHKKTPLS